MNFSLGAIIGTACAFGLTPAPRSLRTDYLLRVDSAGASSFSVEMHVHGAPDTVTFAMAAHPEYDDRFWRYVRDVHVTTGGREVAVVRVDSMLWRVVIKGGEATLRYRVEPPSPTPARGSWRAYLSTHGGLVGGPHSFMFVLGHDDAPARVALALPGGWDVATGMSRAKNGEYVARDFDELMESPILVGHFHRWPFVVRGVPHDIVYMASSDSMIADTTALVRSLKAVVEQSFAVFRSFPYSRYVFIVEEGVGGALEHRTSLSVGINSAEVKRDGLAEFLASAAHEYFHAWNEVALRPRGWGAVSSKPTAPSREIWWMEGVTMSYADLLTRRAELPALVATRRKELEVDIADYLDNPGSFTISPEEASFRADELPNVHPGPRANLYTQGKLLSALLDLKIRNATNNRRSLDDAMKLVFQRHANARGYTGSDLEAAINATCACDLHTFFLTYVRTAHAFPFDEALSAAGLAADVRLVQATDSAGTPLPDLRVGAWLPAADTLLHLQVPQPAGAWARSGLAPEDRLLRWNGKRMTSTRDFRAAARALTLGDSVRVVYQRGDHIDSAVVHIRGYTTNRVILADYPDPTPRQVAIRRSMLLGGP